MTSVVASRGPRSSRQSRTPRAGRDGLVAYGLVAPNIGLLALFVLVPLIGSVLDSLRSGGANGAARFVGFANYTRMFSDEQFWRATLNTVLFTAVVTPVAMGTGLLLALLLNGALPGRGLFRTLLVLPISISGVATALLGSLVFDQNGGLFDSVLTAIGLPSIDWQSGGVPAFASISLITLWSRLGFNLLIYLAALQSVAPDLLEAARLDGAGAWARLRHVVVPLLGPASFFLLILNVVYSFQVFDLVYVLTGGGPRDATSVLVTYAYDNAFASRDQGYGAAIGMVLLLFTIVFTAVRWRGSRTRDLAA